MRIAGWLALISAFVTIPLVYVSYRLEGRGDWEARMVETAIQVVGTAIFLAVTMLLKKFLHDSFRFFATDRLINLMIKANIVICAIGIMSLYIKAVQESISVFVIFIIAVQGVLQAAFGVKLLKLPDDLNGMLRPYCYINIATGITLASVVLLPVGILLSAISDLMLGTILLQTAKNRDSSVDVSV